MSKLSPAFGGLLFFCLLSRLFLCFFTELGAGASLSAAGCPGASRLGCSFYTTADAVVAWGPPGTAPVAEGSKDAPANRAFAVCLPCSGEINGAGVLVGLLAARAPARRLPVCACVRM